MKHDLNNIVLIQIQLNYAFFASCILDFVLFIYIYVYFCFFICWQLAMTHTCNNTPDRDANSLHKNDVTWCDFLQGQQV